MATRVRVDDDGGEPGGGGGRPRGGDVGLSRDVAPTRRRPFGVIVVVVLLVLSAAFHLSAGLGAPAGTASSAVASEAGVLPGLELLPAIAASLSAAAVTLLAAVGLWRLRRWAWVLVMLIVGLRMAENLWQYVMLGDRPYVEMLGDVLIVFYLNQREVQRAFERHPSRNLLRDAPIQPAP
jgi:hypothetical protein